MITVRQALLNAATWFRTNPDGFTTGRLAEDKHRLPVPVFSKRACAFCGTGRFLKEIGWTPKSPMAGYEYARSLLGSNAVDIIINTNDGIRKPEAVASVLEMIAKKF